MPRKPKHPRDMTADELLRRAFPKEVAKEAKRVANPPAKKAARKPKAQVKSTKDKSSD